MDWMELVNDKIEAALARPNQKIALSAADAKSLCIIGGGVPAAGAIRRVARQVTGQASGVEVYSDLYVKNVGGFFIAKVVVS